LRRPIYNHTLSVVTHGYNQGFLGESMLMATRESIEPVGPCLKTALPRWHPEYAPLFEPFIAETRDA
jgi:hypothetical protein